MSSGGKIVCLEECKGGAIIDPRSELSILERHEYDKGLREIFNLLTIRGDYQVIGSGAIQEIKYGSDYDLQEFVKESDYKKSTKHLLEMFRNKFRMAAADPDVFILDFKCGVDDDDKPIRWDKKSIKKGSQMVDGRKVTFQECLLMKSTIKMDITALVDGVFIEFSDNYYLTLKDFNTFTAVAKSHEDILYSLQHEAEQKYHHGDYWKAMKRIFAYMKSKGGYVPKVKQLVRYFNSATGLLSKNRSELDIIALIIVNKFRKPRLEDVVRNLQLVRQELAKIHGFKLNEVEADLDRISKMPLAKMSKPLEEVITKVKGMVNADAKLFLNKHTDITALILDTAKLQGGASGGSKNSGFVQRMIAEKKVKIKKVKDPSQWLLNNHKTVSAPRTKPNIELVIEEEEPPKKAKKAKAKAKVELVIEEDEPPKKAKKAKAKAELVEEEDESPAKEEAEWLKKAKAEQADKKKKIMKTKDVSKLSADDFATWLRDKLKGTPREGLWRGTKDKLGNWFAYNISPFRDQLLIRPDREILDFRKDSADLTAAEDKIYGKVFDRINEAVEDAFGKKGGLDKLYDDFSANSKMFAFLDRTLK